MKRERGKIRDSALKAVVRTPLFKMRVVEKKKGKGSYTRKGKRGAWPSGLGQAA